MPSHRPMTAAWAGQRHATRMGPWGGVLALCIQTTGRLPLGVCATALPWWGPCALWASQHEQGASVHVRTCRVRQPPHKF